MTGITQSPDRNTSARPSNGIRSMQNEEAVIMQRLTDQQVEAMVERYWKDCTPPAHRRADSLALSTIHDVHNRPLGREYQAPH
jgi:hypothetical protein